MVEELSDGGRWDVLSEYTAHAHRERPHQGKVVRIAVADPHPRRAGPLRGRQRLSGLRTYAHRAAASAR